MFLGVKENDPITLQLESLVDRTKILKNKSDFIQLIYEISYFFENLESESLLKLANSTNSYIDLIDKVFYNEEFNNALYKIVNKAEQNDVAEEAKLVNVGLKLAVFALANIMPYVRKNTAIYINQRLRKALNNIFSYQDKKTYIKFDDLCQVLLGVLFDHNCDYRERTTKYIKLDFCFNNIKISKALIASMLTIVKRADVLNDSFKTFLREKESFKSKEKKFSLSLGLDKINKVAKQKFCFRNLIVSDKLSYFDCFISNFDYKKNELSVLYIIEKMTEGFCYQEECDFFEVANRKIDKAESIKKDLNNFIQKELSAYVGKMDRYDDEWSNKIYLISVKTLSILEVIKEAKDKSWVIDVFLYEFYHWVNAIHSILNKYDIEDDWEKIKDLVTQEDSKVEWKSTFFTQTETKFVDDKRENEMRKSILHKIVKAMIGMMNADGGVILVGVVENPEKVVREDVKANMVKRNGVSFFNVNYELEKKNKTLDSVKREIQDALFNETLQTTEKFNNLWAIYPLEVKENYEIATIYKIEVFSADKNIFDAKREDGAIWISLTKRADGRTIKVDPREYLAN